MHASAGLSAFWLIPFALMLGAIAVLPLAAAHFWESNARKAMLSLALGLPVAILYLEHDAAALLHAAHDYLSFVILLGGLFVVSGGVRLSGDLRATPAMNTAFLAVGGLIASFVGTTGASMLLIRPLLETNQERKHVVHTVVFFILLVSNVGGCLTPLGDPPLFLGYLAGVPFTWTFRLWPEWSAASALLLGFYFAWDRKVWARETVRDRIHDARAIRPLHIAGVSSLVCLAGIVAAVAFLPAPVREVVIVLLTAGSYASTPAARRAANRFTFHPILEVMALFAGIFATMLPALEWLRTSGGGLGVTTPRGFFWATGLVSSLLDNAPTYLAFLALGQGLSLPNEVAGVTHDVLAGISLGAVFMGANTYIGNGPNFMVKAIADERGVPMPSFLGFMVYSLPILLPIYLLVTFVFLP